MGADPKKLADRARDLHEFNPMLGFRGCRLAIAYPEIAEMQARAIFEAAVEAAKRTGKPVVPEVMVPLIATKAELDLVKASIDAMAEAVARETGTKVAYQVGTMIELPRASLRAAEIAETAEFFSFGTNDLTQTAFGISRDDAASFLGTYMARGILRAIRSSPSTARAWANWCGSASSAVGRRRRSSRSGSAASTAATPPPSRSATRLRSITSRARRSAFPSHASPPPRPRSARARRGRRSLRRVGNLRSDRGACARRGLCRAQTVAFGAKSVPRPRWAQDGPRPTPPSAFNFSTSHCTSHPIPHIIGYRQAAACPRAAQKTQTYRSLRFIQWQPWCRRQAQ